MSIRSAFKIGFLSMFAVTALSAVPIGLAADQTKKARRRLWYSASWRIPAVTPVMRICLRLARQNRSTFTLRLTRPPKHSRMIACSAPRKLRAVKFVKRKRWVRAILGRPREASQLPVHGPIRPSGSSLSRLWLLSEVDLMYGLLGLGHSIERSTVHRSPDGPG